MVCQGRQTRTVQEVQRALFHAFRRHGLDIRLLASDEAATTKPEVVYPFLDWIKDNMNEYVGAYCTHWYVYRRESDDLNLWGDCNVYFSNLVQRALSCGAKRAEAKQEDARRFSVRSVDKWGNEGK